MKEGDQRQEESEFVWIKLGIIIELSSSRLKLSCALFHLIQSNVCVCVCVPGGPRAWTPRLRVPGAQNRAFLPTPALAPAMTSFGLTPLWPQ